LSVALTPFEVYPENFPELSAFIASIFGSATPDRVQWWFNHWWRENPNWHAGVPRGWLLRDQEGRLVAFTANIPFSYVIAGKPALCLVTGTTAVHPAWRGKGVSRLVGKLFAEQKGAALLIGVDSVPAALKTGQNLGFTSVPLRWPKARAMVAEPKACLERALSRSRIVANSLVSSRAGKLLELPVRVERYMRRRTSDVAPIDGFDAKDDEALRECRASSCATFALRDAMQLNWLYGRSPATRGTTMALAARRGPTLVGFVAFKRQANHLLLLECRCRDLDAEIARDLLLEAQAVAARDGLSHIVVWPYSGMLWRALPFSMPMRRQPMSYCYKSNMAHLDITDWEKTPGDGDISVV
jgi:GNAT superfamily N-acetyltransferase